MRVAAGAAGFLLSLTAIPISYLLNKLSAMDSPMVVFATGAGVLLGLLLVLYLLVIGRPPTDPLFYAFAVFSFTSVIDLIISLEQDGYINGFMGFYMKEGEPYLRTAYGILICYWDGTVHYALYLMMIAAITLRWRYRSVGLYWLGSIIMSLVTLLLGTVVGKFGTEIRPAFLLNVPYVLIPIWAGKKIYRMPRALPQVMAEQVAAEQRKWLYRRPLDVCFIIYLLFAAAYILFKGFIALECSFDICDSYAYDQEPYLLDPVMYAKIQVLVNMFYLVPFFGLALYGLIEPGCEWMPDLTVVFAGAIAQAQFSYVGASLHPRTSFTYRIPQEIVPSFLYTNIFFAVGAQLLAFRCVTCSNFFLKGMPRNTEEMEKKVN
ncbi:transmembrane 6 superfamily member 2-like isoform X1 [Carcharodon carcharias]|uniref:transmembrane 6 superfamily member 2-like isoform X1 n=2 Tax=Carcharodon carcharias TaxID=13397 RepID=UPI001B7F51FB|nr:transmembrane 6 superfamily member 2-like isoform X1 [Carcharodon carcharias]